MFNIFSKKQPKGKSISLRIDGMHCTSCSMNIDGELEDTKGVISATTSYPKSTTEVEYDPEIISEEKVKKVIEGLGYTVK